MKTGKFLSILILLVLIIGITFRMLVPVTYEYSKGDILLPDYVHLDTLVVTKSFNLPDSIGSDGDILEFIKPFIQLYNE